MGHVQYTADGKIISHDDMSHQHLSNCVWHFRIWANSPDSKLAHFFETLDRRFNGELLPFRPVMKFTGEIDALYRTGMVERVDEYKSNIRFKGKIIGEMFNSIEAETSYNELQAYNKEIDKLKK